MINGLVRRSCIFLPGLALALAAPICAQTLTPPTFPQTVEGTTSAPQNATLKNGQAAPIAITKIAVTGDFAQATGSTCPVSPAKLAKGASCTIPITFSPTTTGTLSGKLTVTDSAANSPQNAPLSGTGIVPVIVSPASLTFAALPVGETSGPMPVTLTNNQSAALTIKSILTSSAAFAVASTTCPSSLGAGASCTVQVTFTPTATGTNTGKLTFTDSASSSPQRVALSGTGQAPALLSIAVTPASPSIYVGSSQQFTATGTYSNNTTKNLSSVVTWTALPLGIASMSSAGLATGLAAGSATITAALGSITNTSPVTLTVVQLFAPTSSLNTARYYHSANLLTDGNVLVAGGIGPVPGATGALGQLASAELYNPGTGMFIYTDNLNTARDEHSATLLNNGSVLIAGGSGGDNELASAELYNPAGTFTPTGSLNTARYEHTATVLPDGTVLIAGGYGSAGVLASAEIYNPTAGTFTPATNSLNDARFDATATLLPNGMVLIAGGANASGPLSSAELYNPANQTFTPTTGSLNVARSGATATLLNTGNVLIANGYNYLTTGPLTSAELYNPSTGSFILTGSEATTGWLGAASLLSNGTVLVAGSALNSAVPEIYDPVAATFSLTSTMITPRDLPTATLLPDGAVLIAGGHSNATDSVLAAAELYEPPTLAPPNLSSIAVTPSAPSLAVGASQQMIATGTFTGSNNVQQLASVIWISSNPAVATVTDDDTNTGVVYAVAAGNTIISACTGTICGAAAVTVTAP